MKMARIVMISYVLLTVAITVGNDKTPEGSAVTRAADCCNPCPPLCPPGPTN
jgi:hypothetical protein